MALWEGDAILLASRRHGESLARVELLTPTLGRLCGVMRTGRRAGALQPGAQVFARWQARLDEHLGRLAIEPVKQRVAVLMDDPLALATVASICAVLQRLAPERSPLGGIYAETVDLLDRLETPGWAPDLVAWELALLRELGFGLDLGRCAVTDAESGLRYVSPRTGRAVSQVAAVGYETRLLPLPGFLTQEGGPVSRMAIAQGLALTGAFLCRHVAEGTLPEPRARLARLFDGVGPG